MDIRAIKSNCIERILRKIFRMYSKLMCRFPFLPVVLSLLATIGFGMGLIFFECEYSFEALYVPDHSQALRDQKKVSDLFPLDFYQFSPSRVYDTRQIRVSVGLTAKDDGNLFAYEQIQSVLDINEQIMSFPILHQDGVSSFRDLCAKWNTSCVLNPLLIYLNNTVHSSTHSSEPQYAISVPYPKIIDESGTEHFIDYYVGDALVVSGSVSDARFLLVEYFLRGGPDEELSRTWERAIVEHLSNREFPLVEVAFSASDSLDQAQEELLSSAVANFIGMVVLMTVLAMFTCMMLRDNVMSKPWLPLVAVVTVAMAVVSAMGLLSFCGLPFNQAALLMPFLLLWTGLHHVFFMISTWRCNNFSSDIKETIQETLEVTGTSITIATLTEIVIFFICATSSVPVIRAFCLYTGVAMIFNYVYQFTILAPIMLLFGHIEVANRHCCTCLQVRSKDNQDNSTVYNVFCAGGSDEFALKSVHIVKTFFDTTFTLIFAYIIPLLVFAIFLVVYIVVSIVGSSSIAVGLEIQNMAPTASHTYNYLDLRSQQMTDFGPLVSVVFTEEIRYWDKTVQRALEDTMTDFEKSSFVKPKDYTQCWFIDYYQHFNLTDDKDLMFDEDEFISTLRFNFLGRPNTAKYELDIKFQANKSVIASSRCILSTQNVTTAEDQGQMMQELRAIASRIDTEIVIFAPDFFLYEQQMTSAPEIIKLNIATGLCTLIMALLLVPNPFVALCVCLMTMSILTGLTGFMSFWGISLDVISIINLLICVGISIELSTHLAYLYTYVSISPISRLSWSLGIIGFPVCQSVACTLVSLFLFVGFPAYFYQTFAKVIFLTMSFGLLHSLIFFPTILMILFKGKSHVNYTK
ncbi:patched domain-containing protein 3-like isoform X2 [Apostichopus japonicus]